MSTDDRRSGSRNGSGSRVRNENRYRDEYDDRGRNNDHYDDRGRSAGGYENNDNRSRSGSGNRSADTRSSGNRNNGNVGNGSNGNRSNGNVSNGRDGYRNSGRSNGNKNAVRQGSRTSVRKSEKKKRTKIILFIVEIFALAAVVMFLWGTLQVKETGKINIPEEKIVINEVVREYSETTLKGYRNVALFGVDSTSGNVVKGSRSDSIMIASIDLDTGDCRLVSVYRDTYLNLGNDSYLKCNAAYAKGGAEQAINMLNMNLDMNITDFIAVGFKGVTDTVDALGGIMIDVDESEIKHLNSYNRTMADDMKREYVELTSPGYQKLTGLQATAYCRIRYTAGDDFKRAERQREVLTAIFEEAKKASPSALSDIASNIFGSISTSLDISEIISLLGGIAKYDIVETGGFPEESMRSTGTIGAAGSCVVPVDLEQNVVWLHEFLFDVDDYTPSDEVKEYSQKISADTGRYVKK